MSSIQPVSFVTARTSPDSDVIPTEQVSSIVVPAWANLLTVNNDATIDYYCELMIAISDWMYCAGSGKPEDSAKYLEEAKRLQDVMDGTFPHGFNDGAHCEYDDGAKAIPVCANTDIWHDHADGSATFSEVYDVLHAEAVDWIDTMDTVEDWIFDLQSPTESSESCFWFEPNEGVMPFRDFQEKMHKEAAAMVKWNLCPLTPTTPAWGIRDEYKSNSTSSSSSEDGLFAIFPGNSKRGKLDSDMEVKTLLPTAAAACPLPLTASASESIYSQDDDGWNGPTGRLLPLPLFACELCTSPRCLAFHTSDDNFCDLTQPIITSDTISEDMLDNMSGFEIISGNQEIYGMYREAMTPGSEIVVDHGDSVDVASEEVLDRNEKEVIVTGSGNPFTGTHHVHAARAFDLMEEFEAKPIPDLADLMGLLAVA